MASRAELEKLYDEHAEALFRYVLNLLRNEADARDVLQDVFVKLAGDFRRLAGVRQVRGYLIRMAHNLAIDLIRRRSVRLRHRERHDTDPAPLFIPAGNADTEAIRRELDEAMRALPLEQRAVVHLKLLEEMTFKAIAEALKISPNTAASRYRYGIDKLRDTLRPVYEEMK